MISSHDIIDNDSIPFQPKPYNFQNNIGSFALAPDDHGQSIFQLTSLQFPILIIL